MEIELQKQDYQVQKTRTVPLFMRRLSDWVDRYGDISVIVAFCLVGYLGVGLFLGNPGVLFWGALVTGVERFDAFRFVTSIFLHANFFHILVNLLSLYAMTKQLRYIWSKAQIFLLFFWSGVLANYLGYEFYNFMGISISAVGASGGLFGLLGAMSAFLLFHRNFNYVQKMMYLRQLLPILILNLLLGLFIQNIALMIHILGFFLGLVLGWILDRLPYNFVKNRRHLWTMIYVVSILYILICFAQATTNFFKLTSNLSAW